MTNNKQKLQEQLLAEFDAVDKFGKFVGRAVGSGAKAIGSVAGGVAGLGSAIKQGYQAGKQTVGGGGADVNTQQKPQAKPQAQTKPQPQVQTKPQAQAQPQAQGQTKTKPTGVMKNLAKNLGNVAVDTAAGSGYDYRKGVNPNPTKQVPVGKQDTQAQTQTQAQATKRTKTGGKVAGKVSDTDSAKYQRDRRAAQKAGKAGTPTPVPGGKKPPSADGAVGATNAPKPKSGSGGSAVKQGMDQAQKPSKTAQNVGKQAGVDPKNVKVGGQKMDMTDPKFANLRKAIEKAAPGTISAIDKMQPAEKAKLKKAIA